MPNVISFKYQYANRTYDLGLSWDDAAFAQGQIEFGVTARTWSTENSRVIELSASVRIQQDDNQQPVLVVQIAGQEVARILLADLFDESQVLDKIPSVVFGGEPILGCLIRSGLSACIGQMIRCKHQTQDAPWFWERARRIGRCLKAHIPSICGTAAFRAAKCIATAGF